MARLRVALATASRDVVVNLRAYEWFYIANSVSAGAETLGLGYLMLRFLFKGRLSESFARYVGSGDYMSFIAIGAVGYLLTYKSVLTVGRSLITELREGTFEVLFLAPISRMAYLAGGMLHNVLLTGVEALLIILMAVPFGARLAQVNLPAALLALALFLAGLFGMAIFFGAAMLYLRETYVTQNTLFNVVYLMCGFLFPVEYLPGWIRWLSSLLPPTLAMKLLRGSLMVGLGVEQQAGDFVRLALLAAAFLAAGVALLPRVVRTALEKPLA